MGKRYLTLYDITGIQEFIFSSNKAKENIGASIYVQEFFDKILVCELDKLQNSITDWQNAAGFQMFGNDKITAEVVYIGGGNALVVFSDRDTAVRVTKALSQKLLRQTQFTLGLAVAYLETDLSDFEQDRIALFKKLNLNKYAAVQSSPLRGISITRECEDGLPSNGSRDEKKGGNFISLAAVNKRNKAEHTDCFNDLLTNYSDYDFPLDFDSLGRQEGESHIAVVHIDGNSMGRFIDENLENLKDYEKAVARIRNISIEIKALYRKVFKEMVAACQEALKNEDVKKRIFLNTSDDGKMLLPLRPIILNGDDVTFVCDGRIGIQLANFFLNRLATTSLTLSSGVEQQVSACAGIAIVKSHFPFYRAYALAEELCGSAKKKAKAHNKKVPGCWMDYHIVYSGFQLQLDRMRSEQYNVPGMDPVSGAGDTGYKKFNLLLRPFQVGETGSNEIHDWHKLEELFGALCKWPRSRLKNLRNAFIVSRKEVIALQKANSSRNYHLPKYCLSDISFDDDNIYHSNQTPYFEPLELLDFYIPDFNLDRQEN